MTMKNLKSFWKIFDTFGRKISFITSVAELAGIIVYLVYAITYSYYDLANFAGLIVALYCSASYAFFLPQAGVLPLAATLAETFAMGIFFLNSYPVWADRLNNISMYGSRGTLVPVIINIVIMLLIIIGNILAAFARNDTAEAKCPKKIFKAISGGTVCILIIVCFAANTTTLASNARQYAKDTSKILGTLTRGGSGETASNQGEAEDDRIPIGSPADFTIDEEGNYSFSGVEEAAYYMIYLCNPSAVGENDDYLFASGQIENNGSKEYTGNLDDVMDYAYGNYLAKVQAFPEISDGEHTKSEMASTEYSYEGTLSAPIIEYYWNTFDSTLYFQLANLDTYQYEVYPDAVDIIITNVNDSSDSHTVTIKDVSPDQFEVSAEGLTRDSVYSITASAFSSSECVQNQESEQTSVAAELTVGDNSVISGNYSYTDDFSSDYYAFPRVCDNFNLENGGEAGPARGENAIDATPVAASEGSAYSYELVCAFADKSFMGTLELCEDGTFYLKEDGWGPVSPGSVEGIWSENGDGTATLSYNPSTVLEIK